MTTYKVFNFSQFHLPDRHKQAGLDPCNLYFAVNTLIPTKNLTSFFKKNNAKDFSFSFREQVFLVDFYRLLFVETKFAFQDLVFCFQFFFFDIV
jgi:hypothetical protein